MPDPREYKTGSSSLVLGCDSYTSPAELNDTEYIMGQNVVCRGGIVQTRPGSRSLFCLPDGNFQGCALFTPANGVAHLVFAVNGAVYTSPAPFTSYKRLWSLQFSLTARYMAWTVCLKSTDYDNEGNLIFLDNPYSVLVMQDGLTRAAYWDGGTAAHINPAPAPDSTDTPVVGYQGTPVGLWMIWSGNRLWVSRGNQIYASDIGNPLKFTESQYINEGRAFYLSGPCTGMVEVPSGQGEDKGFIAFTENDGTLFQSYIQDRTVWLSTPLFQNTILPNSGCVAPRSLVTQYGLNWWFSARGLTNLNAAFRQNLSSRIDYQDNQMFSSKAYLSPNMSGVCGTFYENYLMMSVPSADVLNRHTWVLDQAPFEGNVNAWTGFWSGWRPIEWCRGIVNGDERVFFGSIDYDGKNRVWEAMLDERTDNGCAITCYAQLREHAAGNLDQKRYEWTKFFLSQIYGTVYLNAYVASTKGGYQLQKNYKIVATEGQIYADQEYSESGPLMMGNRVQSRIIRTPADPDDDECNACGVESKEGNKIDYAFSHLLVWSGQMGIRAYQMHMREYPERIDGDCEEPEEGPRVLNAQGCSGLELFVDGQPFSTYSATADGSVTLRNGGTAYIQRTVVSGVSQEDAQRRAECAVVRAEEILGVVDVSDLSDISDSDGLIIEPPITPQDNPTPSVSMSCVSESGTAELIGFSEFVSPSTPPKKYRRKIFTGIRTRCNYTSQANCNAGTPKQGSDRFDFGKTCEYNAITGLLSTVGTNPLRQDFGVCPATTVVSPDVGDCSYQLTDGAPQFPLNQTPTNQTQTTGPQCSQEGTQWSQTATTFQINLSVEDTEADAMARATLTPGTSCMAFRGSRGAGEFSFSFEEVNASFACSSLVIGRNYRITYDLVEENYGGGGEIITPGFMDFTASAATQVVPYGALVAMSGKQLSIQNIAIQFT